MRAVEGSATTTRKQQQNFEAILRYYKASQWAFMLDPANSISDKLETVLQPPLDLNLRNASEPSAQLLTLIYLLVTQGQEKVVAMDGYMKYEQMKYMKQVLKRKSVAFRQVLDQHVVTLPNFQWISSGSVSRLFGTECSTLKVLAFALQEAQVHAMAADIPMRNTRQYSTMMNGYAAPRSLVGSNQAVVQQMQVMQRQMMSMMRQGNQLCNAPSGEFPIELLAGPQ